MRWPMGLYATWAILVAGILAILTLATTARAASNKPYSLVICAFGSDESCAPSPTSSDNRPAAVPSGAGGVPMSATFTNENKGGTGIQLGSANLTPPAGFTVLAASVPGCSGCAAVANNVVQLRGVGVPPGSAVTVALTVATPSTGCTVASECFWSAATKQSNDFSGPPGNDLTLDSRTSTLGTVRAHLQFGSQPHNVALGQVITDTDYGAGNPVTVIAVDDNSSIVGSFVGPVSLTLNTPNNTNTNPTPATLGGTTTENASGGTASFADLTVSDPGNGFTLTAVNPDLPPSVTSTTFDAQQAGTQCTNNKSCRTEATSANFPTTNGGVDATVTASSGPTADLAQSIDFGNHLDVGTESPPSGCEGYDAPHDVFWNLTGTTDRTFTVSITTTVLAGNISGTMIKGQDNCLSAPKQFTELNESTTPPSLSPASPGKQPDGTDGFIGLLADCGSKKGQLDPATNPCVVSRTGTSNPFGGGTLTITISVPGFLGDMTSRG